MKGLLENHLNVAALDNDETNKRLTFLFRFEERFRIPLVKRQQFNSSEAEGLLVIHRGCCQHSTNGHGSGFPGTLPVPRCPRNPCAQGCLGTAPDTWSGTGEQHRAQLHRIPLVGEAGTGFLGCPKHCKTHKPTAGWPSVGSGHLCPQYLHPLRGQELLQQMWCCTQWKGHVNEIWGRGYFYKVGALGKHIAPLSCTFLDTALQGWFWYWSWVKGMESSWALCFSL